MNITLSKIYEIFNEFGFKGKIKSFVPVNVGIINSTYHVFVEIDTCISEFILQKINSYVFKRPDQIMSNIGLVTEHISSKDEDAVHIVYNKTNDGLNYYIDKDGSVWRVCNYIESKTFDACDDLTVIKNAGTAFGSFQNRLSDFDASKLFETIENFHNTKLRYEKFFNDIKVDEYNRVVKVFDEISFLKSVHTEATKLVKMLEDGEIPLRVTHNDTKINNVLFDSKTGESIAVVDLDTVMPGLMAYDFGDAVRSCANDVTEDETDLSKVNFNLDKFTAFSEGFIGATKDIVTEKELLSLPLGALTMATELAVRFLDDYITGDKYFKISYKEHNLTRARVQIALAKDILTKFDKMNEIVLSVYNS